MTDKIRCIARVPGEGRWGYFHMRQCSKNAIVERYGKHYCGIHDPIAKRKRDDQRSKLYREKSAREQEAWNLQCRAVDCHKQFIEACRYAIENWEKRDIPTRNAMLIKLCEVVNKAEAK